MLYRPTATTTINRTCTVDLRMRHRRILEPTTRILLGKALFRVGQLVTNTTTTACITMKACLSMVRTVMAAMAEDNRSSVTYPHVGTRVSRTHPSSLSREVQASLKISRPWTACIGVALQDNSRSRSHLTEFGVNMARPRSFSRPRYTTFLWTKRTVICWHPLLSTFPLLPFPVSRRPYEGRSPDA